MAIYSASVRRWALTVSKNVLLPVRSWQWFCLTMLLSSRAEGRWIGTRDLVLQTMKNTLTISSESGSLTRRRRCPVARTILRTSESGFQRRCFGTVAEVQPDHAGCTRLEAYNRRISYCPRDVHGRSVALSQRAPATSFFQVKLPEAIVPIVQLIDVLH
jgi:hypothetical protein